MAKPCPICHHPEWQHRLAQEDDPEGLPPCWCYGCDDSCAGMEEGEDQ